MKNGKMLNMNKIILSLILTLTVLSFSYGQKKQVKSAQQQANEYMLKFNKLSQAEKRQASIQLVNSLNRMDSHSKGIWLAALSAAENNTETMKDVELSSDDIEKKIIKITKINMQAYFFDPKQDSLISIKIIERMSNKDWATKVNSALQNKIDSVKIVLAAFKKERLDLKKKLPVNYNYKENPVDSLRKPYERVLELEYEIPDLTKKLIYYPDLLLKGFSGDNNPINWEDDKPSCFLVEVISKPNDGLDNLPERHYFVRKYVKGEFFRYATNNVIGSANSVDFDIKYVNEILYYDPGSDEISNDIVKKEDALKLFYGRYNNLENLNRNN